MSASYRPNGGVREAGEYWHDVPGYVHVARSLSGQVKLRLTVSREVRHQREKVDEERGARMERERLQRIAAMSRPERVTAGRPHLRLVWSA